MKDYIYPIILMLFGFVVLMYAVISDIKPWWVDAVLLISGATHLGDGLRQIRLLRKPGGRERIRALYKA